MMNYCHGTHSVWYVTHFEMKTTSTLKHVNLWVSLFDASSITRILSGWYLYLSGWYQIRLSTTATELTPCYLFWWKYLWKWLLLLKQLIDCNKNIDCNKTDQLNIYTVELFIELGVYLQSTSSALPVLQNLTIVLPIHLFSTFNPLLFYFQYF